MNWQFTPYVLPVLVAALITAVLARSVWGRRSAPGAVSFVCLMLSVAGWSLGYALELASASLAMKIFFAKVQYLGIVVVPVAWLIFALQYAGRETWVSRRNVLFLAVIPLLSLVLVWTNELHSLIWQDVVLDTTTHSFAAMSFERGPWYWVNVVYAYLLLTLGAFPLLQALLRPPRLFRRQTGALLLGVLAPWTGNALYILNLNPFPHLDLTPFSFTLSGVAVSWGLLRLRLLDLVPIARDAVIESMNDGVIVLDTQGRIVDLNPAAQGVIDCVAKQAIGQPVIRFFADRPDLVPCFRDAREACTEITLGENEAQRYYDLRISLLHDRRNDFTGRLVVLRDITRRKRAATALQEAEERFRSIFENAPVGIYRTTPDGRILAANPALVQMLGYASFEDLAQRSLEEAGFEPDYPRSVFKDRIEKEGRIIGLESAWIRRDGVACFVRENASVLRDDAGNVLYYEGTVEDVTERRQIEEALRARERFLSSLSDITRAALETPDMPAMLQTLVGQLGALFGADACYLTLWDDATEAPRLAAAYGELRETYPTRSVEPCETTLTESVLRAGHPLVIADVSDTPYLSRRIAELFPHRTLLGLPLIAGDQKLGAALIAFTQPHDFTPEDVARGAQAAEQIALAVAKAQLYAETQRRLQEQIALREAGAIISSALTLETVLGHIAEQMGRAIDATSAYISSLEEETLKTDVLAEYISPQACPQEHVSDLGESHLEADLEFVQVLRAGQHKISHLADQSLVRLDRDHMQQCGAKSILYVPLMIRGHLLGYTELWESRRKRAFSDEEIALCHDIAQQAAIAIENARLYEETRKNAETLAALYEVGQDITSTLELDALLQLIARRSVQLAEANKGLILLVDMEAEKLIKAVGFGFDPEQIDGITYQEVCDGISGWVLREKMSSVSQDIFTDPRNMGLALQMAAQESERSASLAVAPLFIRDRVIGTLTVINNEGRPAFNQDSLGLVVMLANQAAVAIENARLYAAIRQELTERAGAEQILREYAIELEASNEELDAFAHTVAHDLKNPLGHIIGFAETLEQISTSLSEGELCHYLHTIATSGRKMSNIIDELLLLASVRKMGKVDLEPLDMASVVEEAQRRLSFLADEYQAEVLLPESWPAAKGYGPWVEEVWVNYLSNAIKYGGKPPRIELGATELEGGAIRFWVRDNGAGLTLEEQARLFTLFERLDRVRAKGHGIGLSIVSRIVERLGGQVGVESQIGQGSVFSFSLPRADGRIES